MKRNKFIFIVYVDTNIMKNKIKSNYIKIYLKNQKKTYNKENDINFKFDIKNK